jgi:DNA-binding MarR family transcriptional regulator
VAVTRVTKAGLAREVWQEMLGYFLAHRSYTAESLQQMGLTPGHMKTLFELDSDDPRSMGELAEVLACDASNATWLIDRLEERGLVERRPHPGDRRVKTVVLTTEGVATKKLLIDQLSEPPADLLTLDRAALDQLAAALDLLPEHPPFWEPAPRKTVPDPGAG